MCRIRPIDRRPCPGGPPALHSIQGECRKAGRDTARGEHALGLEVAGESSGRWAWPWRAWLGRRSRLWRWLSPGRPARPHPGRGRLSGRSRLPRPHQRPAPAGRHAAGPPRSRPDRGMPPRPGFPPGSPRQAPRDGSTANRPWARPDDSTPFPPGGRPRPRPGRGQPDGRGPANDRPRPQAGSRVRATAEETMMSNGRRVPRNGASAPPRGPRPEGFRGYAAGYDQTGSGVARRRRPAAAQAARPGGPGRPGRPARPGRAAGPSLRARGRIVRAGRARPAVGGTAGAAAFRTGTVGGAVAGARPGVVRTRAPRGRLGRVRAERARPVRAAGPGPRGMGRGSPPGRSTARSVCLGEPGPARAGPVRPGPG